MNRIYRSFDNILENRLSVQVSIYLWYCNGLELSIKQVREDNFHELMGHALQFARFFLQGLSCSNIGANEAEYIPLLSDLQ